MAATNMRTLTRRAASKAIPTSILPARFIVMAIYPAIRIAIPTRMEATPDMRMRR